MIVKLLFVFLFLFNNSQPSYKQMNIYAQSYIVMDGYTTKVLEGRLIDLQRSVASISKIMTAIIALENGNLNDNIVITKEIEKVYGSMIYASIGQVYTLEELLYGLLLRSGNDAAVMIAKHIGGDISNFVKMMNIKARELRMNNTIFVNPSGLDEQDGGNLSTAYDMALLMAYASKNETFNRISGSTSYRSELKGYWENKNRLLKLYDKTISGKTGYTRKAKRTLSTAAKDGHTHLVIVTLNCGGDFSLHKQLYEHYFNKYERRVLLDIGNHEIEGYNIEANKEVSYMMEKEKWSNTRILLNINEKDKKCYFYLVIDGKDKVLLDSFKVSKVIYPPNNDNWFNSFINWLKEVFSFG